MTIKVVEPHVFSLKISRVPDFPTPTPEQHCRTRLSSSAGGAIRETSSCGSIDRECYTNSLVERYVFLDTELDE